MTSSTSAPEAAAGPPEAPTTTSDGAAKGGRPGFRGDLDGLRAVAVLLVVAFHVRLPGFDGGFIGVDVFFVISGYLITRNLVSEIDRSGGVALLSFWGRRLRRLVPALALMLVVVLVLALFLLGPLRWEEAAEQARAAALYVSNYWYAAQPTGYFGADLKSSLFLHTWSLGVEEQFYLVWPVLFLAATRLGRGRARQRRSLLTGVLAVVLVGSFAWSVLLTRSGSSLAFFGLPSRAWEFAAAGLVALVAMTPRWLPRWARGNLAATVATLTGLVALAVATVALSDASPYPGYRALLPVGGTLLIVVAGGELLGAAGNPASTALALRPAQWLGRLSYSWYLWHWPLILLAVELVDRDQLRVRVAGAVVALGVAWVAHRLVENPVRFSPWVVRSRALTYGGALALTLAVVLTSVGLDAAARQRIDDDPILRAVELARSDEPRSAPCAETAEADGLTYCIDGDLDADRTVVLYGDSHAGHWRVALAAAAEAEGMRLVTLWEGACPSVPVEAYTPFLTLEECDDIRRSSLEVIAEVRPEVVVLSNTTDYELGVDPDGGPGGVQGTWERAYTALVDRLRSEGTAVVSIVNTPSSPRREPLDCLAEEDSAADCRVPLAAALGGPMIRAAETSARAALGVPALDVNDELCDATSCAVVVDGPLPVLYDKSHLTATYTLRHVDELRRLLAEARSEGAP